MMMSTLTETPGSSLAGVALGTGTAADDNVLGAGEAPQASAFGALLGSLSQGLSAEAQPEPQGEMALEPALEGDEAAVSELPLEGEAQVMDGAVGDVLERMMWSPRAETSFTERALPQSSDPEQTEDAESAVASDAVTADSAPVHVGQTAAPAAKPDRDAAAAPVRREGDVDVTAPQPSAKQALSAAPTGAADEADASEAIDESDAPAERHPMAMEDLMAWQRAAYTQDALPTAPRAQEPPQQQEQQPAEGALRAQMFATATGASTTTGAFAPRAQGDAAPVEEGTQNVGEASLATFDRFVQEADDGDAAEVPSHQAPEGDAVAASLLHQPQAAVVAVEQERAPEATEEPARDLRGLSAGRERFAPEQAAELQEEDGSGVQAPEEGAAHPGAFQHALRTVNHEVAPAQDVQQAAEAGPPVPAVAVSQELSQAITHGARRVQMRIVPEGLGELDIKVQMTGQQVHLTIRGDAPELAQLLTHKVQELRQDLQQQGLSLGAMDFGTLGASSGGSSMSQDGRSQQSRLDDDGQGGLQRLAGAKESTSTGAPRSRPRGAGPSHRIIDVVL